MSKKMKMDINDALAWLSTEDYHAAGYGEALSMAAAALEKHIPVKPVVCSSTWNISTPDSHASNWYACGECGFPVNPYVAYCPRCARAIDWLKEGDILPYLDDYGDY